MRHRAKGRQLSRTSTHKRAMLNNMASSLFEHGHIGRQQGVDRADADRLPVIAGHLAPRMDPGVRPPGHRQRHRVAPQRHGQRALQLCLHRALTLLTGPAGEIRPVVFDQQPSSRARHGGAD